ncbi:hypothetical protein PR048_002703 [Dryococelus australis]|uniref:Death domain-containing protein n=1 Tax=Dryococelus australis TaxID=614101 RepID=A0ABQ9IL29_9NEOP|nr:hypothetical protein PR048_002703 [Dryococelus australis]
MLGLTWTTIDINMDQFKYLANSLTPEECRRLYAALEDPEFEISFNLDTTERKVPLDMPCLALLLHWSSTAGQGKGATHEMLSHRLRQLKHDDLAEWLSGNVFHQLAIDLDYNMKHDPLGPLATEESLAEYSL